MARRPVNPRIPGWIEQNLPPELADSGLFRFKITLPNAQQVEVDLRPDADVDYDQLERQLEDCPAQLVWWGALYSEMKSMCSILERKTKARRGVLTGEATNLAREGKAPKLSADQVKLVIESDETLNKLEAQLILAQKSTGKLWYMVQAIQMKSEHLRSLAGFKRQEREAQR